jgi:hypothetical protein
MNHRLLLLSLVTLLPWSPVMAGRSKEFTAADRAWWSFQPVHEPSLPGVKDTAWTRTPVDRFILARLEGAGLVPAAEASKAALVRRVYFDLLGLPPTREQVEAYVSDSAPDAWEKLVDRLLASPRYGERQARLWLDLVRYADSDGYKADDYRPDAWRYRDYVVTAFNDDKPYDIFLSEQLAGDELFPGNPEALVATGYLRHWIYEYNNRDAAGQWKVILNDITDTTADVFMGLGLQCARCHDHKFDPLLQADYYRLQAFFAPLDPRDGTVVLPKAQQAEHQAQQEKWEHATAGVRQRIAEIQAPERENSRRKAVSMFPPETQDLLEKPAAERTPQERQIADLAWKQVLYEWERVDSKIKGEAKEQLIALRKELAAFDSLKPGPPPTAMTARDVGPVAPPVTIPRRETEGGIPPGFPTLLAPEAAPVTPRPDSTGRRSALAAWLARPENPLTARVMVNRVWQQHFGKGLTTTASDFGTLGDKPSHPELLDWLAHQFTTQGWSLKKLHRLILTSAVWRQGHLSPVAERARLADPENRLLWRWTTKRLEAEQIRDAIFHATGELDLQAGGPGVDSSKPRRTIYTKILRNVRDPLTEVFDAPQNFQSTASRDTTTTATQSLFLANSRFMGERAEAMALSLSPLEDTPAQVEAAWWRTQGRAPTTDEREEALSFLDAAAPLEPVLASGGFISETMPQRQGKATALSPGSPLERLEADLPELPQDGFTVETVALLHSVYESGAVRTLAGQWSGNVKDSGWAVGITGLKSRRNPRMPVFLLCGPDRTGQMVQEPVFSDFQLQLDRSYYLGVAFQPATADRSGTVTFYVKDLANEDEPLRTASVPHPVTALTPPPGPLYIGASHGGPESLWDGLIDEVRVTRGFLTEHEIALRHPDITGRTLACWQFEPGSFRRDAASGRETIRLPLPPVTAAPARQALTDLCHALLSSSGLLYVE